jgi:hypothetical protein
MMSMATPILSIWPISRMVASVADAMVSDFLSTELIMAFVLGD